MLIHPKRRIFLKLVLIDLRATKSPSLDAWERRIKIKKRERIKDKHQYSLPSLDTKKKKKEREKREKNEQVDSGS